MDKTSPIVIAVLHTSFAHVFCGTFVSVFTQQSVCPPTTQLVRVSTHQSVRCVEEVTCSLQPLCSRCLGCAWSGLPTNCAYTSHVLGNVRCKKKCAKNVASYSETRHDWNLNEEASLRVTVRAYSNMTMVYSLIMELLCAHQTNHQPSNPSVHISFRSCKLITSSYQLCNIIVPPHTYSKGCVTFSSLIEAC
jgi:hypothetical protein